VKPVRFHYARPSDIAAAVSLACSETAAVKILAGGQSLGPLLNLRLVQPDLVIDITAIDELKRIEETGDGVTIGSCITHADVEDGRVPDVTGGPLRGVAAGIAYRAVRNRGTVGGSLVHADPSADWISAMAALGAEAVIQGKRGQRRLAVETLMTGVFECSLAADELLSGVRVPRLGRAARWGYYKHCRKTGELAQAIGAYLHDPDRAICRAVIGATGGRPILLTDAGALFGGREPCEAAIDRKAVQRAMTAHGMTDPIEQQIHFACLRRAIAQAYQR
jgi:aerobic carbon-monoxide dehydrogenase medium subunit